VFLRYGEKSVWLTDFLNLERKDKLTFLGRKFQTLITRVRPILASGTRYRPIPLVSVRYRQ